MDDLRVGIVGAGKMGIMHSCIFNMIKGSSLVALCDTTPLNLKMLHSILPRVKLYDDYNKMLDDGQVDMVVITTPVFLHKRMAEKVMNKGIACFVEKPLALNAKESKDLAGISTKAANLVGYCRRFMGTYNAAKDMVDSGEFGEVRGFDSHMYVTQFSDVRSGWQYEPGKSGGGVLMDLGSHAFDMINYLLGDVETVSAKVGKLIAQDIEEDSIVALKMRSKVEGRLEVSWSKPGFRLPEMMLEIKMDKGSIKVCEKSITVVRNNSSGEMIDQRTIFKQEIEKGVQFNVAGPEYTREDEHILEAMTSKKRTRCDFLEAAKANYAIEAAYSSIKKNGDVQIVGSSE